MNNNRTPQFTASKGEAGLSLVELLVGIAIGLMVVLAATGTLVLNRSSSNTISDTAAITAQASNALRQMAYLLRQTGPWSQRPHPTPPRFRPPSKRLTWLHLVQRRLEPLSHTR
jgi:Tfp pilus assembly protein PilW